MLSARQLNRACQKRTEEARSHSPQPPRLIPAGPGAEAAGTDRYVRAPLLPSGSSTVRARRRDLVRRLSCSMALSILGAASPEPRTPPAAARPQPIAALAAPRPRHPGRLRACAGRGGGRFPQGAFLPKEGKGCEGSVCKARRKRSFRCLLVTNKN